MISAKESSRIVPEGGTLKGENMTKLNLIDYEISKRLAAKDIPFYALIAGAIRKADTGNLARLESAFPEITRDLKRRYNAPGGVLPEDNIQGDDASKHALIADSYI